LVFKRILASFNFTVNTHFIINPISHYLYEPEAHNSLFQHSIIPIGAKPLTYVLKGISQSAVKFKENLRHGGGLPDGIKFFSYPLFLIKEWQNYMFG